jgi:DNA-binding transcriptional regulator YiaG
MDTLCPHRPTLTARTRTVRRAAEDLGGDKALAHALGVTPADVANWISQLAQPHDAAFFAALDIVARGPRALR